MDAATYTAATGMKASYRALEIATNNLANVNSPGFKADKPFYRILQDATGKITGSNLAGTVTDFRSGPMKMTGNPLDLAINGEGYFTVRTPGGDRFTRNGSFSISINGDLVTQDGFPVLDRSGNNITVVRGSQAPNKLSIGRSGEIMVDEGIVGQIGVVTFANPNLLAKEGNANFSSAETPMSVANPVIQQGSLEQSNVNAVEMMLELIRVNRAFDFNQKTVMNIMNNLNRRAVTEIAGQTY